MFQKIKINLNNIDNIKKFINIVVLYKEDIDMISGRFLIDAKSVMGLFSLDLSKDVYVSIHTKDINVYNRFNSDMEEFKVE